MPLKMDETNLEYKKRKIDTVSSSFCAAKWFNATIWLGSGETASCHHPKAHKINIEEIKTNPRALHNTREKKEQRKMMLKGERPKGCEYCWRLEDMGPDVISDRVFKTVIYEDKDIDEIANSDSANDVNLKTLEIAFDRTCNFACAYCNPNFSTSWGRDIEKNGPYRGLKHQDGAAFTITGKDAQPYKEDENPYIKAFWKWWPELSSSLFELRVTGGEPLMSQQVWKLFDYFEENESDIRLSINSNLGAKDELIDRLIEKSHYVKNLEFYTSCESVGLQAEFVRDGLNYDKWKENLLKVIEGANIQSMNVMMTINALSIFSTVEFLDEMLEIKKMYGRFFPVLTLNILRFPALLSVSVLPQSFKEKARNDLALWIENNKNNKLVHSIEIDGIRRLMDYLDSVTTSHGRAQNQEKNQQDLKVYLKQYAFRRNKNLKDTFPPEFTDWLEQF